MLPWQVPHPVVSVHNDGFMEYNKLYDMIWIWWLILRISNMLFEYYFTGYWTCNLIIISQDTEHAIWMLFLRIFNMLLGNYFTGYLICCLKIISLGISYAVWILFLRIFNMLFENHFSGFVTWCLNVISQDI